MQRDVARDKTFFAVIIFRLKGGIFTPRFTGTIPWAIYLQPRRFREECFISFSRGGRYIRKACSTADNKNRLFPARTCIIVTAIAHICSAYQGSGSIQTTQNNGREKKRG
ncbi:hypothetical protein CDAR_551541 [Caerostris darwini]|uniref:Uncharacterized protein n=1 Tax=Caerostris darwini TaxID=1538125 RepID=A0AAV4V7H0_9ARAC|nr:hypothetical protein CDAR_551541 [Caerostris darwini]